MCVLTSANTADKEAIPAINWKLSTGRCREMEQSLMMIELRMQIDADGGRISDECAA